MLVQSLDLLTGPLSIADWNLVSNHLLALDQDFFLFLIGFEVFAGDNTFQFFEGLNKVLKIFLEELVCDDAHVSNGVDFTFVVHNFRIREASDDMEDAIDGLDMGKESISKTLTFAGSGDQTSDVENGNGGCNLGARSVNFAQTLEAAIGHVHFSLSWLNRAEGVVLCGH